VKLFIFFFPLVRLAFLAPIVDRQCAPVTMNRTEAVQEVAGKFFSYLPQHAVNELNITKDDHLFLDWVHMQHLDIEDNPIDSSLLVLADFNRLPTLFSPCPRTFVRNVLGMEPNCFRGCFPQSCEKIQRRGSHRLVCYESCQKNLGRSLSFLYLSHLAFAVLFIVITMLRVRMAVRGEIQTAKSTKSPEPYTFLQYQEKCHMYACYKYLSSGGSYVEDFLEVVLGFAVLVCFASVSPRMALVGFVVQLCEYRLLMYRTTWITCRPFPATSEGLGEWFTVLDGILFIATGMNALLLICVKSTDLDDMRPESKLIVVVLIVLSLVSVRVLLRVHLHERPFEIVDALDLNHEFVEKLEARRHRDELGKGEHSDSFDCVKIGVHGE